MILTRSQRGFAALGLIVAVVVVGLIGGGAWYALHKNSATNSNKASLLSGKQQKPPVFQPSDVSALQAQVPPPTSGQPSPATSSKAKSSLATIIDTGKFQAVRLQDDTFYVGKLSELSVGHLQMQDTYYTLTSPCGSSATTCLSLAKHSPDVVQINTADVVVWANLASDSQYTKAIQAYEKHNIPPPSH